MRASGSIESGVGLGPSDHVCWAYSSDAERGALSRQFLADGVAAGAKVLLIGPGSDDQLADEVAGLAGVESLLATGQLEFVSLSTRYDSAWLVDPTAQAQAYAAATAAAIADGFTGLRVAADATVLALDPDRRAAFARYEHEMDRLMAAGLRFSAMCLYDRRRLDEVAIAEVSCVHPAGNAGCTPFRLSAADADGLACSGEIDTLSAPAFGWALDQVRVPTHGSTVVVDCVELAFVDHNALLRLESAAMEAGVHIAVRDAPPTFTRLAGLMQLERVATAA